MKRKSAFAAYITLMIMTFVIAAWLTEALTSGLFSQQFQMLILPGFGLIVCSLAVGYLIDRIEIDD